MDWQKLLRSIRESVDEELRLRNTYLVAENRILRQQINGRVQLSDSDRQALAEIGQKLGRKALEEIATLAQADTILAWHWKLRAQKGDTSQPCTSVGRPRIAPELEALVVRMARENCAWEYDRIVGALANLGYRISDQTVGNILKRHGLPPAPDRKKTTTWREFIRSYMDFLIATDFFTSAVWSWLRRLIAFLRCFLRCDPPQVHAVRVRLHQATQGMCARLRHAFAVSAYRQRWRYRITKRSQAMRWSRDVLGNTSSAFARTDKQQSLTQALGTVVFVSAISPVQIRDRPLPRQRYCDSLLDDSDCKAA